MTITPTGPRLLLPGLVPREPGLETYWVRPGGVTAVRLEAGDQLTVIDRAGRQEAELTVAGPGLGVSADAWARVARSMPEAGRAAVLGLLGEFGVNPVAATPARLFGEWSPAGARETFTATSRPPSWSPPRRGG